MQIQIQRRWLRAAVAAVGACALVAATATVALASVPGHGRAGAPSAATLPKYYVVKSSTAFANPGTAGSASVLCNAGDHATGGGFFNGSSTSPISVERSYPSSTPPTGWTVLVFNNGTAQALFSAFADCVHY